MFLDIGAGILISLFISHVFSIEPSLLWVALGILFALLPDIDMVFYFIQTQVLKRGVDDHRSFTHYPIIYLPIACVVGYVFGLPYAVLFASCVYFHFIHDSLWLGWGISWLAPFSQRKYKFFPDKDGKISSQVFLTWTKDDEQEIFKTHHNPNWVRDFYLKPNIVAYVEYSVFLVSLYVLYISFV